MAVQSDVTSIIDNRRMSMLQYVTIAICFVMNMLDGMDVLVIAFTARSIADEWGVSASSLGVVLSAAVAGMTIGALFVAPLADRLGRKKLILICAIIMGASIYVTALSQSISQLMILRFISGLGIGGMLASVSTLASEYAPSKTKDFWVSLVMSGYPVGAVLAGFASSLIIPDFGWRAMFQFAGLATIITIPFIIFVLPESLHYLLKKRPVNALQKINKTLIRMKAEPINQLPDIIESNKKVGLVKLFEGDRLVPTFLLWLAFFMAFATLYFLLSWIPKLTTDAGMPEQLGYLSGIVFNVGSFIGILVLGGVAIKFGLRRTILVFLCGAALLMILFGNFLGTGLVLIMFGCIGFLMQGGFVGLYPVAARLYPTEIRSTGIGWAIGAGRLGAVLGPILAGFLVEAGLTITTNFIIFSIPCIIAGLAAISIKSPDIS